MRLPDWDYKLQRWDQFAAFHIGVDLNGPVINETGWRQPPNFVMFDTGELIFTGRQTRPHDRVRYDALNLTLTRTIDSDLPVLLTPDGRPIPRAQLNDGGSQLLIIDHDCGRAVHAGWHYQVDPKPSTALPERFRKGNYPHCLTYWPGVGRHPIGANQITVAPPFKQIGTAEAKHVREVYLAARAALTLDDQHPARVGDYRWSYSYDALSFDEALAVSSFTDLDTKQLSRLYHKGVRRKQLKYDYLVVG